MIFAALYQRSPVDVPLVLPDGRAVMDVEAETANRLQRIAWRAVSEFLG